MGRWPGEEKKLGRLPFAQGVDEDSTDFKARGPPGKKKQIYDTEGIKRFSNK